MKKKPVRKIVTILVTLSLAPSLAWAAPDLYLGGLAQPQLKWEQQDPKVNETNPRNSGFALHRARLIAAGSYRYKVLWEGRIEAEMVPTFQLLDAWLAASGNLVGHGYLRFTAGQQFAPFSRQTILPAHTLQMVDYAQLVALTPGRQLGLSSTLAVPYAPWLQLSAGVFNGKGINIVENLDSNLMYVGRVAFRPIGDRAPLLESALGPDAIWIAGDVSYTKKRQGDFDELDLLAGADAFVSMKGFSAYVEYLWGSITYSKGAPKQNYHEQGFNAQAGYLLPVPGYFYRRFEATFRFEAVAPNQTVPITGPGDPTQARASYIAGLGYYHRGHNLKVQLNYSHNQELDDIDASGHKTSYDNDSHDGASVPQPSYASLGQDPTPKFVHLGVGQDARTGVAIIWRTNDEETLATTVQYGSNGMMDKSQDGFTFVYDLGAATASGISTVRIHETHLCGLTPDTQYSYRVGGQDGQSGKEAWSQTFTFRTLPSDPTAEVAMLIIGDTRDGYSTWGAALQQAFAKTRPDIILFDGDATTLGPIQDEWEAWFQAADPYLPEVPMVLAHGNHDVSAVNWFSQFAQPGNEQDFAIDFGAVHLTVANDSPIDLADVGGANAQKLDANLKAGATAPWNLLLHHRPMYSASAGPHPADVTMMRQLWLPIVDADKVDVVFNGHDHDYERSKPLHDNQVQPQTAGATVYFVLGSAGADLYDNGSDFWTAYSEKTFSFAIARVRQGSFQLNAYRGDGTMMDSFMMTK